MTSSSETEKKVKNWVLLYLGAVCFIIVPLYMRNGYFALISAKARAFLYTVIPALIVIAVIVAAQLSSQIEKETINKDKSIWKPSTSFYLLSAIGIWSLISSGLSQSFKLSLMGTAGWSVGSLMTVLLVICTIYVSVQFQYKTYMALSVMAVNTFINLLAILQSAGWDPFGLLRDIQSKLHYTYLSTIGQKNSFSGYLCLVLPLFWGAFIACRDRVRKVLFGIFAVFGFMGIIVAESDSTYAGVGICILFMLPYVFRTEQHVKRSSILLMIYGGCLLTIRHLPVFAGKIAKFKGISLAMVKRPAAEVILICGILLYLRGWKIIRGKRGRYILIAIESALVMLISAYAVHETAHFNDKWGTKRGMIWRVGWERFLNFPIRNKLTGIGPEMLTIVYREIRDASGLNVISAHCEPLQVLLTLGIIGLGIYIVFWGYLLILFIKNRLWEENTAILFFPLAAYWGQSLFCSVYPVTSVVFCFISGMYLRYAEKSDI